VREHQHLPKSGRPAVGFRSGNLFGAQFKTFWDATGGLWTKGALAGKAASMFFSTASQGGGQETTALTGASSHPGIWRMSTRVLQNRDCVGLNVTLQSFCCSGMLALLLYR